MKLFPIDKAMIRTVMVVPERWRRSWPLGLASGAWRSSEPWQVQCCWSGRLRWLKNKDESVHITNHQRNVNHSELCMWPRSSGVGGTKVTGAGGDDSKVTTCTLVRGQIAEDSTEGLLKMNKGPPEPISPKTGALAKENWCAAEASVLTHLRKHYFTSVERWEQPTCPSTQEQLGK